MIHYGWLFVAASGGVVLGIIVMAMIAVGGRRDW
jgi:hypothetical protein